MTKLPVISGQECIKALQRAGFYIDRQRGSHITLVRDHPPGRATVPNHKVLKRGTLRAIIRDCNMTVEEFLELL